MVESRRPLGSGEDTQQPGHLTYPLPDSRDGIADAVRAILDSHPDVYAIHIISGQPIQVETGADTAEVPLDDMPVLLGDIISKIHLESVQKMGGSPEEFLKALVHKARSQKEYPRFVVVGDRAAFSRWYSRGHREDVRNVLGMVVHDAGNGMTPDTAVVCVTPSENGTPLEVRKGYLVRLDPLRPKERQI